jgi:DedD protein
VESRVKERLTGAVILVAAIVLLVPELLSGPHREAAPAAAALAGPPLRSLQVDLREDSRKAPADAPAGEPAAADSAPAPTVAGPAQPTLPATPAAIAPSLRTQPSTPPVIAPSVPASSAPARGPSGAAASGPPRAAPAAAAESTAGGWLVQVGTFASRANAERLAHELRSHGFKTGIFESAGKGRALYRVRVGPVPDHAAAQALATRLRAAGHAGALVPHT